MNELLKINTTDSERITVSARDLYEFLEATERFNSWFERMTQYGLVENTDYTTVKKLTEVPNNGGVQIRELDDYQLTIDTAKQIAMLQRNEKGTQARKYFIQVENAWNSPERVMARALTIANKTIETLKIENSEMKPKADYFDNLVERNLLTNFRDTAKELGLRQTDLINNLIEDGYVYRDQKSKLRPYAKYGKTGKGLFELKEFSRNDHSDIQTLITPKGRETFRLLYTA
nr:MAG TPA: antirepressor protein [Caudoviricetes sp.]